MECCRSHWAVSHHQRCWDCVTLELAESRAGLAVLMSYRSVSVLDGVARPVPSVLDCLIAAEEVLAARMHVGRDRRLVI